MSKLLNIDIFLLLMDFWFVCKFSNLFAVNDSFSRGASPAVCARRFEEMFLLSRSLKPKHSLARSLPVKRQGILYSFKPLRASKISIRLLFLLFSCIFAFFLSFHDDDDATSLSRASSYWVELNHRLTLRPPEGSLSHTHEGTTHHNNNNKQQEHQQSRFFWITLKGRKEGKEEEEWWWC